jgi:heme/copper-type cytochrome/quinol oxidase subunit 2
MKRALRIAAAVLLVVFLLPALASACPLCKDAASTADKPGQADVWRGMYWSILLMVAAPFTMVGAMIVAVRRARRRLEAGQPPPSPPLPFPEGGAGARS